MNVFARLGDYSRAGELAEADGDMPAAAQHYAWAERPEIVAYCGGVNRNALKETLEEFERREGCSITTTYAGCGTIVGNIEAGKFAMPDTFMTCDVTYMDMVQSDFLKPADVSSTRVVMRRITARRTSCSRR